MARIRTIKPDLAYDEELSALPERTRLFFILLWTHCDKAGRVDDKPATLRAKIFPYHPEIDVEEILTELSPKFVVRFEAKGKKYLQIRTWVEHQRPNNSEADSIIPAPTTKDLMTINDVKKHLLTSKTLRKGKEGKGKEVERKGTDLAPASQAPEVLDSKPKPLTPIQCVVRALKECKGIPVDDKDWDRKFFARHTPAAKELLAAFDGNVRKAVAFIIFKAEEWKDLPDWGLEGIIKAVSRDYQKIGMGEENGPERSQMGADRVLDAGRSRRIASAGSLAGEALRAIEAEARPDNELAGPGIPPRPTGPEFDEPFLAPEHG